MHTVYVFCGLVLVDFTHTLQWRHNGCDGVTNHQRHDCLIDHLFGRISKKTSKLRATGLCAGNSPVSGEYPAQMASNTENGFIWWRPHDLQTPRLAWHKLWRIWTSGSTGGTTIIMQCEVLIRLAGTNGNMWIFHGKYYTWSNFQFTEMMKSFPVTKL